jgi:putative Ca2+/H+ antiporter (TMEM165/GDT1 family)
LKWFAPENLGPQKDDCPAEKVAIGAIIAVVIAAVIAVVVGRLISGVAQKSPSP